jgi:hypothetical protein
MTAKNKNNQSLFNRCITALNKYNSLNDLRDKADNEGNEKEVKKYNRLCENSFDKYLDYLYQLPKYEQNRIENL